MATNITQIQRRGLRTLNLLGDGQLTLDELADKLCISKRYTQRVIRHLKDSGCIVNSRMRGRTKYFWVAPNQTWIPAILTPPQWQALDEALSAPNPDLKAAVFKLVQYTNVQLYFQSNK